MRQVYRARAVAEAHLVKGYLESAGITAVVSGEDIAGLQGLLPAGSETSPAVWVADQDYVQAEALVTAFLQEPGALTGSTHWRCPTCGEDLEPQFTACWQCGTSRPPEEADLDAA